MSDLKTNGKWDINKIRESQKKLRESQKKDPTNIYFEKYQKKNKTHPRIVKCGSYSKNHGQTGQVVNYTSKDGKKYSGVGDNFKEARRNLCKFLLNNNIDI